jgi:hypothetical protein
MFKVVAMVFQQIMTELNGVESEETEEWPSQKFLCQRGHPTSTKSQLSDSNKNLVLGPRRSLTPRLTGRLAIK